MNMTRTDAYEEACRQIAETRSRALDLSVAARGFDTIADEIHARRPDSPLVNDAAANVADYARGKAVALRARCAVLVAHADHLEANALREYDTVAALVQRASDAPVRGLLDDDVWTR